MCEFVTAEVYPGKTNALVKNIMRQMGIKDPNEAVRRMNSGEWVVSPKARNWWEVDGVIYLRVTSDGTTGPEWIERLEKKGYSVCRLAKNDLLSPNFKPTSNIVYEIAIMKGERIGCDGLNTLNIRAAGKKNKLHTPNAEIACLVRENFTDKDIAEMGFSEIAVMHEPLKGSDGEPGLLGVRGNGTNRWLKTNLGSLEQGWSPSVGFAFEALQIPQH